MKRTIVRKILNNKVFSIKRFFKVLTGIMAAIHVVGILSIGGCDYEDIYKYFFIAIAGFGGSLIVNIIGAISTRLLFFSGLLQRKNVLAFFFEC